MAITLDGTNGITTPDLAVDTNTLFVDAVNNLVGVGTSAPVSKLDLISGDARMLFTNQSATAFFGAVNTSNSAYVPLAINGSELLWKTGDAERARIDASGNLLVGTTGVIQSGKLVVNYLSAFQRGLVTNTDTTGTTAQLAFVNPNGIVGQITTSGSSTSYATSSDYRLKEDVQPMVNATDRVLSLKPVNFAWKVDGTRVDGFLAHEAQAVVPEAVTGEKDGEEMQAIDQSKLVPLLTAALQEALQTIKALEARVAALETPA